MSQQEVLLQYIDFIPVIMLVPVMIYVLLKHVRETWAPSFFTTMGIFGTFVGLFLGLLPFILTPDNSIADNFTSLIRGVGIAMGCSVAGIFCALISKGSQHLIKNVNSNVAQTGATADTLADLLKAILEQQSKQTSNMAAMQKSIAGDGDGTLLTQLQKIRASFSYKQDELIKSFRDFSENMAKSNSEALIEALQEVIKDFNQKISEQFGDNFKHLNLAVGKLLEWQENYKEQLIEIHNELKTCSEGMQLSRESLSVISDKTESIVKMASSLEEILLAYKAHKDQLAGHLEAFASLSTQAKDAFPTIRDNIENITVKLSDTVEKTSKAYNGTLSKQSDLLTSILKSHENTNSEIHKSSENLISSMRDSMESISTNITSAIEKSSKHQTAMLEKQAKSVTDSMTLFDDKTKTVFSSIQSNIDAMTNNLSNAMNQVSVRLEEQVVAIDKALEEELTKSLNSLGSQLVSLSNKFVSDYTPLTSQLKKIVEMASETRSS